MIFLMVFLCFFWVGLDMVLGMVFWVWCRWSYPSGIQMHFASYLWFSCPCVFHSLGQHNPMLTCSLWLRRVVGSRSLLSWNHGQGRWVWWVLPKRALISWLNHMSASATQKRWPRAVHSGRPCSRGTQGSWQFPSAPAQSPWSVAAREAVQRALCWRRVGFVGLCFGAFRDDLETTSNIYTYTSY